MVKFKKRDNYLVAFDPKTKITFYLYSEEGELWMAEKGHEGEYNELLSSYVTTVEQAEKLIGNLYELGI